MHAARVSVRAFCVALIGVGLLPAAVPNAVAGSGNYLIITAQDYAGSAPLTQFANAKAAMGFTVSTYVVPSGTTRDAIKAHIQSLWGGPSAPKYILLVGDTDGSSAGTNTIPHWVGSGSRAGTTDLPYACMDGPGDWYPNIFIGRFSVRTVSMLQDVVNKTLFVEAGNFSDPDYVRRAAFLATDDSTAQAAATHDWVINNYMTPANFTCTKIYAAQGGNTAQVTAAVNAGALFCTYFGHSDYPGWWAPAFDISDVQGLSNTGLYGLALGWSCHTAQFDYDECFGETWLRAPNKGAAAYLSASAFIWWGSIAEWDSSRRMEKYFFQSFFVDNIWEVQPAWQAALWRILADPDYGPTHDHTRNIFEEFVLLGDPALELPHGPTFTLAVNPGSQSLCCPSSTQATYTINVGKTGDFTEAITLTAPGVPAGATTNFSVNSIAPPFTSVLTVGNLGAAAPGAYNIVVTGTSASAQRTTPVGLSISTAAPGSVVLKTPLNGATNVARSPTLIWEPAAQALTYDIQVSTNPGFTAIVYSAIVAGSTSHTVANYLAAGTPHYWHVRANNGCGTGAYSAPFSFTTIVQADYFTEEFNGDFDLDNFSVTFTPSTSGSFYDMCGGAITAFPTDPTGGTNISLGDEDSKLMTLTGGKKVKLYGASYPSFWVGSNGYITFTAGDTDYQPSLADHFDTPRISMVFDDLTPNAGGTVSWKQLADRAVVTVANVPEWNTTDLNNYQVEMFFDGQIRLSWLRVDSTGSIAGLSAGQGVPVDYLETNLSAAAGCTGACCVSDTCAVATQQGCLSQQGEYFGSGSACDPFLCAVLQPQCLIISEIIDATLSGSCPRFVEITNTGLHDFTFAEGGLIVQMDYSTDVIVDVDLTGVTIPAGYSYVINSNEFGACTGAFEVIYGFAADKNVNNVQFGDGNDRYILTDTANGSHLLDIYGEFGVSGGDWSYEDGYSYRLPAYNSGTGQTFVAGQWHFGGKDSLEGPYPEQLLMQFTTPGTHLYDHSCTVVGDLDGDGDVDFDDYAIFEDCLTGPGVPPQTGCENADLDFDGDVDLADFAEFQAAFEG